MPHLASRDLRKQLDVVNHQPLTHNGGSFHLGIVPVHGTGSREWPTERQLLGHAADSTIMSIKQKQMERHRFTRLCFKTPLKI
jgi:hypothetical protein